MSVSISKKSKSLLVKINRLWKGKYASLRDYQVKKALQEKKDLRILLLSNGETMTIPYQQIRQRAIKSNQKFKSRIDGKEYSLIDFYWQRDLDLSNPQDFSKMVL